VRSIEDAVVALRLYKKYLELEKAGVFQEKLLEIYRYGKMHGWEVA
jgi:PAB-dependent poly(A)-specific ribonuclease subunit 2